MHQHLGEVGAEGLVLLRRQDQLHRSVQAAVRLRREDQPLAAGLARKRAVPPGLGLGSRHRPDEIDRSAALDRIDQKIDQRGAPGPRLRRGQQIDQEIDIVRSHPTGSTARMTA